MPVWWSSDSASPPVLAGLVEELGDVEDGQAEPRELVPVLLEVLLDEERVDHLPDQGCGQVLGLELVEPGLGLARDLLRQLDGHPRLLDERLEDLVRVELLHRLAGRPHVELPALDERLLLYLPGQVEHEPPQVRDRVLPLLPVELDEQLPDELPQVVGELARLLLRLEPGQRLERAVGQRPLDVEDLQYLQPLRRRDDAVNRPDSARGGLHLFHALEVKTI